RGEEAEAGLPASSGHGRAAEGGAPHAALHEVPQVRLRPAHAEARRGGPRHVLQLQGPVDRRGRAGPLREAAPLARAASRGRERPAQHLQERLTMSRTLEDVRHVASLARLSLSAEEEALMRTQLSAILDAVAELSQVDTSRVEPTSHAAGEVAPWRAD